MPIQQDTMSSPNRVEEVARQRLRSLRLARGWSLDELSRRSLIGASTISRIETGHRRLVVDNLAALARALETTADALLNTDDEPDVVIRPMKTSMGRGSTVWLLNRSDDSSGRVVAKMRLAASKKHLDPQVHPGRDWFFVLEGTARLVLGDREYLVETGQAAEFDTMTPHAIVGYGGPVELLSIFDRHGQRAHLTAPAGTAPPS
jgi:transcriptional regulator with XRE-family HTH domain